MMGDASVAMPAPGAVAGGKDASLRGSGSRRALAGWRPPRITEICGRSGTAGAAPGVSFGGGRAASFSGAAAAGGGAAGDATGGAVRKMRGEFFGLDAAGGEIGRAHV